MTHDIGCKYETTLSRHAVLALSHQQQYFQEPLTRIPHELLNQNLRIPRLSLNCYPEWAGSVPEKLPNIED